MTATVPYCGTPPSPAELWTRWNLDPVLVVALVGLLVLYGVGARRLGRTLPLYARFNFGAGWAIAAAALISPLCPLSVSLFAARVGQHMVIALLAAPLVVIGRPVAGMAAALGVRHPAPRSRPWAAAAAFAGAAWFWHAPGPYGLTFSSDAAYWCMHVTIFASATWLWSALLDTSPGVIVQGAFAGLLSSVQMGLLGALITLAPRAFYAPHALTTQVWGFTPLQDQQLGGGIMWVPGCLVFLVVAVAGLRALLAPATLARS